MIKFCRREVRDFAKLVSNWKSRLKLRYDHLITCDNIVNTPGTAGGPGGRDLTLAVKSLKTLENLCVTLQLQYRAELNSIRSSLIKHFCQENFVKEVSL